MKRSEKAVVAVVITAIAVSAAYLTLTAMAANRRQAAMARLLARPVTSPTRPSTTQPAPSPEKHEAVASSTALDGGDFHQLLERAKVLHGNWALADFTKAWQERSWEFTNADWEEGERLVAKHQALVAELSAMVAARAPVPRVDWQNAETLRALCQLVVLDSEVAFRRGDSRRGVQGLVTVLELAAAIASNDDYDSPWSLLFHGACDVINRALPAPPPDPAADELVMLLAAFEPHEITARTITAYAQWRAEGWPHEVARWATHGESWLENPLERSQWLLDDVLQKGASHALYGSALGQTLVDRDVAKFLDIMTRTRDAALAPFLEAKPLAEAIDRGVEALHDTPYYLVQMSRIPATGAVGQIAVVTARRDLAQLGILVERHRAGHGAFPESLEAIAGRLTNGLPIDPFSGQDYIYRALGDRVLLYSIGYNEIDDGGNPTLDLLWRPDLGKPRH